MGAHTKGPWRLATNFTEHGFTANDGSVTVVPTDEDAMFSICDVKLTKHFPRGKTYKAEDAERDANARLIAAAPDLLKALKNCVLLTFDGFSIEGDCEREARDAIAKAEGK